MAGPLYRQIADQLRRMIESGDLEAGDQVPTEDQLMAKYHASRNTIRNALKELATGGWVDTRHGKGTFVSLRVKPILITLTSDPETGRGGGEGGVYTAEVAASGRVPQMGDLAVSLVKAGPPIAGPLRIPEKTDVIVRHEDGFVDGLPWLRQTSYYPRRLAAQAPRLLETSNIEDGVVAHLAERGIEQSGYRDEIEWRTPDTSETSYFDLPPDGHIKVVEIRRIAFDRTGIRIRLTISIWRADRIQFVINVGDVPLSTRGHL